MSAATANGSRAGVPLRGVVASIVASVLFGIIALIAANVPEFAPEEVTGWRVVFIVIALLLVHIPRVQRREFVADALRIVRSVKLIIVVIACTTIMWFQLWVFMWAPAHGHTADVAMGYFLLPLVMVVVGRFIFKDPMSRWQLAAVISASVGVAAQLIITRSVGWPVLLIAGLYPVYFGLRRWCKIDNNHVFLIETVLLLVPSVFFIATGAFSRGVVPDSTLNLLILAVLSAVAMTLYIAASGLLPLGLFGLMSYLEPVLLMVAAVILGTALGFTDLFVYGPIVLALIFLIIGGVRAGRAPAALVSGQAALLPVTGSIPVVRDETDEA